jgi:hypothetical protein
MVAYVLDENLRHVRTIRQWRGEFGKTPPFDIGDDTLFVAYSAWAEMTCFDVLGWQHPVHIFDQHTAFLAATNILLPSDADDSMRRPKKDLASACRAYGIEGWERIDKGSIAPDIGNGLWEKYGQAAVFDYCEEDVHRSTQLLRAQLHRYNDMPAADIPRSLHWSNYSAKAVARIQAPGMLIDMRLWNLVQENKAAVVRALLRQYDPSADSDDPIYTPDGEWSYVRFENWLVRAGIPTWPRLESGRLDISSDAFKMMPHHPGIENLHALRDSLGVIVRAKLPIGPDGRNRPSLFPFGTATGRNAHSKSLYNAHASMRSFMVAPPGKILAYLDWKAQEVGIAAWESGDRQLQIDYDGDVYHGLALMCGLTTETDWRKWKKVHKAQRDQMKPLQLGISYGMGVRSVARKLDMHPVVASHILELHRQRYVQFWQWRESKVQQAMLERRIESCFGWPLRITTSPNIRTLYNFPLQSGGAEMLRSAAWKLYSAGLTTSMLIHDGVLLELNSMEEVEHAKALMVEAGFDVCPGLRIDADVDQLLTIGERYRDKRPVARSMWNTMMSALQTVGALPEGELP